MQKLIAFSLLSVHVALGAVFFQSPDELPQDVQYDFIVAGGGTGGGVVAGRLAENPKWKVLVIEAGPSNRDVFATQVPGLCRELPRTHVDWNYTISPQPGLNGRAPGYTRGRMLGGCSSHNGMVFTRGSIEDWNRWAEVIEDDAYSWEKILPFMHKAEKLVQDSENQTEQGHIDPSVHGLTGAVSNTAPYNSHPINELLIQTTQDLPEEFPYLLDMNNGSPIGIAWNQFSIDRHGERSSAATAYVETAGRNLHVLVNTQVTRVLPVGNETCFRGVEFALDEDSPITQLVASKEVIVAGGVIGTPQILLNSGIGKRDELEAMGIQTLVDNASVGKNLTDQVSSLVMLNTTIEDTDFDRDTALAQWNATRTGPLSLPGHLNHIVYVRFPDNSSLFNQDGFTDPTPGKGSPHIEMVYSQISAQLPQTAIDFPPPPPGTNVTIQILVANLHPLSRGSITLNTSNPFTHPNVDFNMLSNPLDIAILREGIKSARTLYSAPAFQSSVFGTLVPAGNITSDSDFDDFLRAVASPFLHGVGSAAMSSRNASWGVVDPDFRVKGTTGLRVVDASVLPSPPSGHTQVPVYAFAERASVLIAEAWK
ncbi:hypothetical protein NP233_g9585 [Leucocoprinus birnbaumii]|uniref:pyranose dehydrogenase (acceptor) n=1 Tax=Leucocoprinus birnbaumii TaxID=56174 RepID=A0AAD5VKB5_9AGAR|nr:hypothetical protein NP233_g9585 [Leucocoprinus birnbaumii]